MQKLVFYYRIACGNVGDDDPQNYKNRQAFTIEPGETVLFIIRNCGNSWLRHGLSFALRKDGRGNFYVRRKRPYSLCLWVQNTSDKIGLFIEEGTTLTAVLAEPEIFYRLCHIPF